MCAPAAAPSTGPGPEPPGLSGVSTQGRQARGARPRHGDAPGRSQDPAGNAAHPAPRTAAPPRPPGRALEVSTLSVDATHTSMGVSGELDLAVAGILAAALARQLAAGHRHVRLDLSGVSFCGCSGLNVLLAAHHQFAAAGGTFTLTGLDAHLIRVLHLTGLHDVLFSAANDHSTTTRATATQSIPAGEWSWPSECSAFDRAVSHDRVAVPPVRHRGVRVPADASGIRVNIGS